MAFSAIRRGVLYLGAAVVLAMTAAGTALLTQTKEALNRAQDTPLLSAATAEERADFLAQYGITVDTAAEQADTVRIPDPFPPVYEQYNLLQKAQGMDLWPYRGREVSRYVYPLAGEEGFSVTLLVWEGQVVGGDVCRLGGEQRGFAQDKVLQ